MVVVASGNNNQNTDKTLSYPANYNLDNIISVAAVDSNGRLPYFTNFGKTNVDLLAPGVDILSTQAGGGYQ